MGAMALAASPSAPGSPVKAPGGTRVGDLYSSSGLTGARLEARKDPAASGGDVTEQTHTILKMHKANLEAMGSSLDNVLKVTVFMADAKTGEKRQERGLRAVFPERSAGPLRDRGAVSGHRNAPQDGDRLLRHWAATRLHHA